MDYLSIFLPLLLFSTTSASKGSIFADLTEEELKEVIDYLAAQSGLNLVWDLEQIRPDSSYVQTIEVLQPIKSEALDYLDHDGPKPVKKARIIIVRGDLPRPIIEEYEVHPVPNPSSHVPLLYSNKRDPIPYTSRILDPDLPIIEAILKREISPVDPFLKTITGMSFVNCSKNCLTFSYGGGASFDGTNRTLVISLHRDVEGRALHPIGLDMLLEMNTPDIDKWKITWLSYRGRSFESFDSLKEYFKNLSPKSDPNIPVDDEDLLTSLNFRGSPRPKARRAGPVSFYPNGPRFKVEGNRVQWLGWSLYVAMPTTTGPRIHDISFLGERIIYELSLQEIAVFYSGDNPFGSHTNYFDSHMNMGTTFSRLFPGVDCPANAKFIDTVHYFRGKPATFKDTVCVFEMDQGVPFRRHFATDFNRGYEYYQGMANNLLIIRSILTVDNYDYIIDVILYQGGQIETRVSLTGYVIGSYFEGDTEDQYGYQLGTDTTRGVIHLHTAHVKVDLDVKGTKNRFRTMTIESHHYPDPLDKSKLLTNKRVRQDLKRTEKEGAYKFNFDTPSYLIIYSEDYKNKFGQSKGYRIYNQAMAKLILPDSSEGSRARSWANYQVSVTRRKDSEPSSISPYTFMEQQKPVIAFEDFIEDNENIVDQDLVAWITLGTHHIPHSEDAPIVTTPGVQLSFILSPYNYFDEDPSLASRDNIRVEPGPGAGKDTYVYSGVPGGLVCDNEAVNCTGVTGIVQNKDGVLPKICSGLIAAGASRVTMRPDAILLVLLSALVCNSP